MIMVDHKAKHPALFEPDEKKSRRLIFSACSALFRLIGSRFYRFTIVGSDRLPRKGAALVVGLHTTHNVELPCLIFQGQRETGRVVRQLLHRSVKILGPIPNYFGGIAGSQQVAVDLLKADSLLSPPHLPAVRAIQRAFSRRCCCCCPSWHQKAPQNSQNPEIQTKQQKFFVLRDEILTLWG